MPRMLRNGRLSHGNPRRSRSIPGGSALSWGPEGLRGLCLEALAPAKYGGPVPCLARVTCLWVQLSWRGEEGCVPRRRSECARWYFRVHVLVRSFEEEILRAWVGGLGWGCRG